MRPGGGFEPEITLFEKTEVNGENEDPIYTFLKSGCPYTAIQFEPDLFYDPKKVDDIRWNFEKFLIDKNGKPSARFNPNLTDPEDLKPDINALLNA